MPRGDGTGPNGEGPLTGRRRGYCAGYPVPGFMNPGFGFSRGFGRGLRLGRGRGFAWRARMLQSVQPAVIPAQQPIQPTRAEERQLLEQENEYIKEEIEAMKQDLQEIEKRLKELE